jgi:hypothetical protein
MLFLTMHPVLKARHAWPRSKHQKPDAFARYQQASIMSSVGIAFTFDITSL